MAPGAIACKQEDDDDDDDDGTVDVELFVVDGEEGLFCRRSLL
jgi:hypothetical protein